MTGWRCWQSSATLATDRVTEASSTTATTTITSRSRSEPALLPAAAVPPPPQPSSPHAEPESPAHGAQRRHGALERQNRLTACDDNDDVGWCHVTTHWRHPANPQLLGQWYQMWFPVSLSVSELQVETLQWLSHASSLLSCIRKEHS